MEEKHTPGANVKKKLLFCTIFFCCFEAVGQEDYHELRELPWNGDWLQTNINKMAGGEGYRGYPGPLPKLFYALGLDPQHPGVDFELLDRVKRDAPNWFGSCNGWAAAAIQYDEPPSLVVNGVKLFHGEVKAYLASIWKDNVPQYLADFGPSGISAELFHEVLTEYIEKNNPIIFDVSIGLESWNFPVAAFSRKKTEFEGYTKVEVALYFTNTQRLDQLEEDPDGVVFLQIDYEYRILSGETPSFEWAVGSPVPDRAWLPGADPFTRDSWHRVSNRHFNLATYEALFQKAENEINASDFFEPNDLMETSAPFEDFMVMASLPDQDVDWFHIEKAQGENITLDLEVYSGPSVNLKLFDAQGQELDEFLEQSDHQITLPPEWSGSYYLRIEKGDFIQPSFYHIQSQSLTSWYKPLIGESPEQVTVINLEERDVNFYGQQNENLLIRGSVTLEDPLADLTNRAEGAVIWASETYRGNTIDKKYHKSHRLIMNHVVPHVTFRNGWNTYLEILTDTPENMIMEVYNSQGTQLHKQVLQSESFNSEIDLGNLLPLSVRVNAAWLKLRHSGRTLVEGNAYLKHPIGLNFSLDLNAQPRNGAMHLPSLPLREEGWIGLTIVNTSEVENQIITRLFDRFGDLLEEGQFDLGIGEKWLGQPQMLFQTPIEEGSYIRIFSQYDIDSVVLRNDRTNNLNYAHRLFGDTLDQMTRSFVAYPSGEPATQHFLFFNPNVNTNWVSLEGFNKEGQSLGKFYIKRRSLKAREAVVVSLEEILGEYDFPLVNDISHFELVAQRVVYAHEMVGFPENANKRFVKIVPVFEDP